MKSENKEEGGNKAETPDPPESVTDKFLDRLDHTLDLEKEDKEIKDKYTNPIINKVVNFVLVFLAAVFGLYSASFFTEKPLPQIEFLHKLVDTVVDVLKTIIG